MYVCILARLGVKRKKKCVRKQSENSTDMPNNSIQLYQDYVPACNANLSWVQAGTFFVPESIVIIMST